MADGGTPGLNWAVGVITCPRERGYYLDRTLDSLTTAGFGEATVFAEPGSVVPAGHRAVHRPFPYGDWTNWATGLYELLLSRPATDYFLMAEDDAVVCRDAKRYVEHALPSLGDFASLSLYTPSTFRAKRRGFHNELRGVHTWSTVAVVMSRPMVVSFFSDPDVQRHRFEDIFGEAAGFWKCPKTDPKNSVKDAVIGQWAAKAARPVYYHTPSLGEHIGEFSTLTDQPALVANGRMSADFVGETADLSAWLTEPVYVRRATRLLLC
jgi:hypothetical protein